MLAPLDVYKSLLLFNFRILQGWPGEAIRECLWSRWGEGARQKADCRKPVIFGQLASSIVSQMRERESVEVAPGSHLRIRHHFDAFYTLEWKKIGNNDVQVVGVYVFLSLPLKEEGFLF